MCNALRDYPANGSFTRVYFPPAYRRSSVYAFLARMCINCIYAPAAAAISPPPPKFAEQFRRIKFRGAKVTCIEIAGRSQLQPTVHKAGFLKSIPQNDGVLRRRTRCHTTRLLSCYRTSPESDGLFRIQRVVALRTVDSTLPFPNQALYISGG
jgi:hypothetical protein